jgi:sialate O-acetylesterase
MINPLKRIQLKGFLWYQGESNGGYNRDLYQCSFPTMIDSWREEFTAHAGVPPLAPFGFVQVMWCKFFNHHQSVSKYGGSLQ